MKSILRYTIFAVIIGLCLLQIVSAQDKAGDAQPKANTEKTNTANKNSELVFPEIEGWEKSGVRKFPTAALGYSIAYQSREGGTVTLYVYNGGNSDIPNGANANIFKSEIERAKNEIRAAGDAGVYQDVKEISNDTITLGGSSGKVKSLYSLFNFKIRGGLMTSEIYLLGYNKNFIKIRATRPKEAEGTVNKAMAKLLAAFDETLSK